MTRRRKDIIKIIPLIKYIISNTILLFLIITPLYTEQILDKDFGFSLDIPEGFEIQSYTKDGSSYLFSHPNIPVTLALKLTFEDSNSSSAKTLSTALTKLNAEYDIDSFSWNNITCSVANFNMNLDQDYTGWATSSPTKKDGYYLVLICYSPTNKEKACEQFIMSTLNSLCIDQNFYNTPGIITSYAFPKEGNSKISITINGQKIQTIQDKVDKDAAQFVVDMEYSVLTLYSKHKSWKEAWQRYYRLIYRDSFTRMQNLSSTIYETYYEECKIKNPKNPNITYAQMLLSWVQNFSYERAKNKKDSDFTCLPSVICGEGSDCDSRSLLLCVLLKSIGIETIFLFSPEYSHAIVATQIQAPGQQYKLEGVEQGFIFGETTAKVTWGMIAKDHADQNKWIPVILP